MGQLDRFRSPSCELCRVDGGVLVTRTAALRVIRVQDPDYPGFYRVVWNDHQCEFSQLNRFERAMLMDAVVTVEQLLMRHLQPRKINLASLGNVVPHLHWHIIARYTHDRHYPQPIWAPAQ